MPGGLGELIMNVMGNQSPMNDVMQQMFSPSSAAGAAPGGSPQSASAGAQQPQQQTQAMTSPPDLGAMYGKLIQRQNAVDSINQAIGGVMSSMSRTPYPQQRRDIYDMYAGGSGMDPIQQLDTMQRLYAMQYQMQQLQSLQAAGAQLGLTPQQTLALGPQGIQTVLAKKLELGMGIGGPPEQQAWRAALNQKMTSEGLTEEQAIAKYPYLSDALTYAGARTQQGKDIATAEPEKIAAKSDFTDSLNEAMQTYNDAKWLQDHPDATAEAVQQNWNTTGGLAWLHQHGLPGGASPDAITAAQKLQNMKMRLQAGQMSKMKNIRTQREFNSIGGSTTILANPDAYNLPAGDIKNSVDTLVSNLGDAIGNLHAAAGVTVPSEFSAHVNQEYFNPKSPLYNYQPGSKLVGSEAAPSGGGGGLRQPTSNEIDEFHTLLNQGRNRQEIINNARLNGVDMGSVR